MKHTFRPMPVRRALVPFALLASLLLAPLPAFAWNDHGHMTIDLLAYRQIKPEVRAKLSTILRAHPRYEQDLLQGAPEGVDKEAYAFAKAGTWPDMVRSRDNPMSTLYHKSNWHYTDVPYYPEGGEEKYKGEPARPAKPGEPYDSISAWEYNLARLQDETLPLPERAVALCWVLHLGGDIHQPCHNVSLYSARFPTGDRGANNWLFKDGNYDTNLHAIWDGSLGRDRAFESIEKNATAIAELHPANQVAEQAKISDVRQWVQECRFLAIEHVYLNGKLVGVSREEARDQPIPQIAVPYLEEARKVSRKQAALAGLRLTNALNSASLPIPAPTTSPVTPK